MTPRRGRLRKAVFGVVTAAALLGVPEAALRAFLPADAFLYSWERADGSLVTTGKRLLPRPGYSGTRMDGPYAWTESVNAATLREDGPVSPTRAPGEKRLLALGDSWIYGISVTQGKTIPDRLAADLQARGWAEKVDVINAGVPSFSAFDVLWRWKTLGQDYAIDGVLLGEPHNQGTERDGMADRSAWYSAINRSAPSDWRLYRLLRRGFDQLRRPRYAVPPTGDAAAAALADLDVLIADIHAHGLPVYVLMLPADLDSALAGHHDDGRPRARLEKDGAIVGEHALGERACWGYVDHGHPSEAGAAALAAVAAELVMGGVSLPGVRTTPACVTGPTAPTLTPTGPTAPPTATAPP